MFDPAAEPFARLRMIGDRFDAPGMPVEALVEIVAYRELVLGVAKEIFRQRNPDRRRLPKGFADRLRLRLERIEAGSAMPVLERVHDGSLLPMDDEYVASRDAIEDAIAATADGQALPDVFPRDALVLFNHFGQTLRPGEAIELRRGAANVGARYTSDVRRKLVLKERATYQEEVDETGWVGEVDASRMRAEIRLRFQAPVPAPLDDLTFEPVKEVLEPNGDGPPVRIVGTGVFDANHRLIRFDALQEVAIRDDSEDAMIIESRFATLARLEAGWLDGEGVAVSKAANDLARGLLIALLAYDVPRPAVFATPGGGVQAEWSLADREMSLTFRPDGTLKAMAVDTATGDADEPELVSTAEAIARFLLRVP